MSELRNYCAESSEGPKLQDASGRESEWMLHASLQLNDARLLIADLDFIPCEGDGLVVDLPPGCYEVSGRVMDYPGDRRISRLRVLPTGVVATLGEQLGETWTDTGATGVCDLVQMSREWEEVGEEAAMSKLESARDDRDFCGVFTLGPDSAAVAPFVSSGFGDGTFPVFALQANGRVVGVEIEFIAADEPYPFRTSGTDDAARKEESDPNDSMGEIGKLMASLLANRTGDRDADRTSAKSALEEMLGGLKRKALEAAAEFRERTTGLRKRAVMLEIHVVPAEVDWMGEPAIQERIQALRDADFLHAGTFRVEELPNYGLCGMYQPERGIYAHLERYGNGSIFLSLGATYLDGREFEVSDAGMKKGMSRPPWNIRTVLPGTTPQELIATFLQSRPEGQVAPVSAAGLAPSMEKAFRQTQLWRADRGGSTLPEIKLQRGLPESTEDTEELIMMRRDSADIWLCNWLRMQERLPFLIEQVLDRLVIIHDELPADLLLNEWRIATEELRTNEDSFAEGAAREAFGRVNREHGNPLRLVLQKSGGLAADFYLPAAQ